MNAAVGAQSAALSGVLIGCLGAFFFSGKAVIIKLAYREGADAISLLAYRMIYAVPLFALMLWWVQARPGSKPLASVLQKGDWVRLVMLGLVGYYLASFLDFLGLQYISVGLERLILYLTPTIVLLLSVFWLKKNISSLEVLSLLVAYSGIVFVFWHDVSVVGKHVWLGAGFVFASAVAYALYLLNSGEMVKRFGSLRLTAIASMISCVACIIQALVMNPVGLVQQNAQVHGLSMVNALFCTVLPITLTMIAIEKAGSSVAAQTGMVGPAASILLGYWFLNEPMGTTQIIGTGIVMLGMFILSRKK